MAAANQAILLLQEEVRAMEEAREQERLERIARAHGEALIQQVEDERQSSSEPERDSEGDKKEGDEPETPEAKDEEAEKGQRG